MPIHPERYRTRGQAKIESADAELASGYWPWMLKHRPFGGEITDSGDVVTPEFFTCNPDQLEEDGARDSGVAPESHVYMQEAYETLTAPQKEVWDAVMREQIQPAEFARRLGITKQAIDNRLRGAKAKIVNYLRTKQQDETI